MVTFKKYQKRVTGKHIVPGVIEPSYGIGRILYSVLEHAFYIRKGSEKRVVLSLPATIAPIKASILPLVSNPKMLEFVPKLSRPIDLLFISFIFVIYLFIYLSILQRLTISLPLRLSFLDETAHLLIDAGIPVKVDDQAVSIGRRYARTDEIGIPFGITIDGQTIDHGTVTMRERDTTSQVRVKVCILY